MNVHADQIVYLDNNATTRVHPRVLEAMLPFYAEFYGNPSSAYRFGSQVKKALETAAAQVAALIGVQPEEIVFTSCGTESDNTAIWSALQLDRRKNHVVTTTAEHSAILKQCAHLKKKGFRSNLVKVDASGAVDLDGLRKAIRPETAVVSVMWANNETGVISDIESVAEIAREAGVLFHSDAVQAAGKIPSTSATFRSITLRSPATNSMRRRESVSSTRTGTPGSSPT